VSHAREEVMKNIVSVIKDDIRNLTLVTYDDGSIEKLSGFFQNQEANKEIVCVVKDDERQHILVEQPCSFDQTQEANKEIVCVVKDDERQHILVVYDDGSREYISCL
jgi:hypothetical protein